MRATRFVSLSLLAFLGLAFLFSAVPARAQSAADPDLPEIPGIPSSQIDKELYLQLRDNHIATLRGLPFDLSDNPRLKAINQMNQVTKGLNAFTSSGAWTPIVGTE